MRDSEKIFSIKAIEEMLEAYQKLQSRNRELQDAVRWALGCNGDFPARRDSDHAYWWRNELRKRAGLDD